MAAYNCMSLLRQKNRAKQGWQTLPRGFCPNLTDNILLIEANTDVEQHSFHATFRVGAKWDSAPLLHAMNFKWFENLPFRSSKLHGGSAELSGQLAEKARQWISVKLSLCSELLKKK